MLAPSRSWKLYDVCVYDNCIFPFSTSALAVSIFSLAAPEALALEALERALFRTQEKLHEKLSSAERRKLSSHDYEIMMARSFQVGKNAAALLVRSSI